MLKSLCVVCKKIVNCVKMNQMVSQHNKYFIKNKRRQTDRRQTHTQNDYCNPRCACTPRVNDVQMLLNWAAQCHRHNFSGISLV